MVNEAIIKRQIKVIKNVLFDVLTIVLSSLCDKFYAQYIVWTWTCVINAYKRPKDVQVNIYRSSLGPAMSKTHR